MLRFASMMPPLTKDEGPLRGFFAGLAAAAFFPLAADLAAALAGLTGVFFFLDGGASASDALAEADADADTSSWDSSAGEDSGVGWGGWGGGAGGTVHRTPGADPHAPSSARPRLGILGWLEGVVG